MTKELDFSKKVLLGFIIVFFMTYEVVLSQLNMGNNDYIYHSIWAVQIPWDNLFEYFNSTISYPLWHLFVKICVDIFAIDMIKAAALVTALFNGFAFLAVIYIWQRLEDIDISKEKFVFWATCLMFIGPLYAPWFNSEYYLGQATPNTWHNPTNIAVKGVAILAFGIIVTLINKKNCDNNKNIKLYFLLSLILLLSTLAKPSFLQGIIPGLALFVIVRLIIEKSRFDLKLYIKLCVAFIPAVIVLILQFSHVFYNADYVLPELSVGIGWGTVLHHWTPNVFISLILSFAFPIFVLLIDFKRLIRKATIQLAICYELAAWLEAVLLYEGGETIFEANFTWANLISAFIVWAVMLFYFIQILSNVDEKDLKRRKILLWVGVPLFAAHLLFGVSYWISLFRCEIIC